MKKHRNFILASIAYWLMFTSMWMLTSCGPSAEERAAMEKAKQDSIANFQTDEASGQLIPSQEVEKQVYIKCIAKDYDGHISNVDVYLIGADTFVVVTGLNGNGVTMMKK